MPTFVVETKQNMAHDILTNTIQRLSNEEYSYVLNQISNNKLSKPYIVLEHARQGKLDDNKLATVLDVNSSTYYTIKSRLNTKVANILSQRVTNPIQELLDEVNRVPPHLYSKDRAMSIRALKDLEKKLKEYDMNNELISVYRVLVELHRGTPEFAEYKDLHEQYVAYALAAGKAEQKYYDFLERAGEYLLSPTDTNYDALMMPLRELNNISELYESHKLEVFHSLARILFFIVTTDDAEALQQKEIEIDEKLKKIEETFEKYPQDVFYSNLTFLPSFLYTVFYQKCNLYVRAYHHYEAARAELDMIVDKHHLHFYTSLMLYTQAGLYLKDASRMTPVQNSLNLWDNLYIRNEEKFVFYYNQFAKALHQFVDEDYDEAALTIYSLRNDLSLKDYPIRDMECKAFQALQYLLINEVDMASSLINSLSRQLRSLKLEKEEPIKCFLDLLKQAGKTSEKSKKHYKISACLREFREHNKGENSILPENLISE